MVQLNLDGQLLRAAILAELERQHEQSGIHDLVVSRCEDPNELRVEGKLNLDELSLAIMKHGVGKAYKAIVGYDPFEDDPTQTLEEVTQLLGEVIVEHQRAAEEAQAEPERVYLYDCAHGQGQVVATNLELAKQRAQREAGSLADVRNVRQATPEDLAVRKAMGGTDGQS